MPLNGLYFIAPFTWFQRQIVAIVAWLLRTSEAQSGPAMLECVSPSPQEEEEDG